MSAEGGRFGSEPRFRNRIEEAPQRVEPAKGIELSTGDLRLDTMSAILRGLAVGTFRTEGQREDAQEGLTRLATDVLLAAPRTEVQSADRALTGLLTSTNPRENAVGQALRGEFAKAAVAIVVERGAGAIEAAKVRLPRKG